MNAPKTLAVMKLLAVIYQDGGQHVHSVGVEQACKEGEAIFLKLRQEVEEIRAGKQAIPKLMPVLGVILGGAGLPQPISPSEMTLADKIAAAKEKLAAEAANIPAADLQS